MTPIPTPVVVTEPTYLFSIDPIVIPEGIETPFMSKEEFPILDGSTANIPLGEAIYSFLTKASAEEAKEGLVFHTTPDAYRALLNHESDLLFVYEPSQTILGEMKHNNTKLEFKPIGRDALVFITNSYRKAPRSDGRVDR